MYSATTNKQTKTFNHSSTDYKVNQKEKDSFLFNDEQETRIFTATCEERKDYSY